MCARICTSPNSSTDSSPQNVLTYNNIISLGQEASYTVLIDLGLTELRNVRDSAAPRSYVHCGVGHSLILGRVAPQG